MSAGDKSSRVTFDGRTIVNTSTLLRSPRVRQTLDRLAKMVMTKDRSIKILRVRGV